MPYVPNAKIIIPKKKPRNLDELLELLFPNHPERQRLARFLLERIHNAEMKRDGLRAEEWLELILEYLGSEELICYYRTLVKKKTSRTEIHRRVEEKAKELGVPFGTTKTNYNIVVKTLQNARMIYKSKNYYKTTKEFSELLCEIAEVWNDWLATG
ncbi:hypothetical protein E3E31_10350 [Thermococcus sp. M39]|uniref:hypothetical protein n=1 Tax=unclassified Thermococcus TaxID=2627626 RepID=UPI001438E0F4|nr:MULTISPECIES: hypothetical protein [unclassified Thermococcus]NJE08915.1 hypothetical protein [Thermococcus sp. M39]NJE12811.1 hypothetical protein [Thermococcus sp. LS2]